ncbi:hypothetical protein GORHZ_130_00100 [Gordonia rhizosphera NBRC 16068]|uniref:Uncharacterized protein n=1 Tax=Gordonia rhizosphera NBRC 16068 TaxID=1108045 RepID=K6WGW1_9ACTN|nr:hypothetical protein GORHZ_130_00100 [Gordonia rhizosphera NBRC 16068]
MIVELDRADQLREHESGEEPGQVPEDPVLGFHAVGHRQRDRDPRPPEAQRTDREQCRDTQIHAVRVVGADAQPQQPVTEQREQRVKRDLDRQAPHLGEPGGQRERDEDLSQCEVRQPHGQIGPLGVGQQRQDDRDHHDVRRPDTDDAVAEVAPHRRGRRAGMCGRDPWTPQQEAGESEEERHREVESAEDRPDDGQLHRPGLEGHVRGENPDRGERTHPLELGKESSDLVRDVGEAGGAHRG